MSPANVTDPAKVEVQRKAQKTMRRRDGSRDRRGQVAEQLVRDWSPQMRSRIRADLLQLRYISGDRAEMQVIALIDKITEEERT